MLSRTDFQNVCVFVCKDDAQSGEESNAGDQEEPENEPDAFEADPFAQPDATQYAVSDGCVSPVTPGVLSE